MTTPDDDSSPTTNMADHEDAQENPLHQCTICERKFNSQSYERHVRICENTASKKRKPFDSAKQRIQGTDLAEFHRENPPETIHEHPVRRQSHDEKPAASGNRRASGAWKEKSDELRRSIKAVKDKTQHSTHNASSHTSSPPSSTHQSTNQQRPSTLSLVTSPGAPQRSNEKGTCPTCQRQFGVKSYDRHVAFCRERATRLPSSPLTGTNVAKERLEARMRYRAPGLKNRKPTNKEKYSPGGVQQQQQKVVQSPLMSRSKNIVDSPKLPQLKRPGQTKESPISTSGPLKSRPMDRSNSHLLRSYERLPRCDLNSYIRRHPNFSRLLKSRIGNNYDPFYLLAEQQMNDLFSDTSDQSSTDGSSICPPQKTNSSPNFPLSHSSAFVKYPITNGTAANPTPQNQSQPQSLPATATEKPQQRASVIAPPTGFDDLTSSDISSDCTETKSLSREIISSSSNSNSLAGSRVIATNGEREHVLGRRIIIDQNQALGGGEFAPSSDTLKTNGNANNVNSNGINSRFTKTLASCNRSNSMRAVSAPKPPERKISSSSSSTNSDFLRNNKLKSDVTRSANNFKNQLNSSNVSLNSIFSSSDMEMKRSASLFDELLSSFEDDANSSSTLPSLMSLIRNDPLLSGSAPQQQNGHHQRTTNNGRINCSDDDAELSSPESVKRQECGKLSADSAYSSLNRKYSNHGRSTNDVSSTNSKYKMSKFCHECGFKFPDSAKFCCECGVRRLTL